MNLACAKPWPITLTAPTTLSGNKCFVSGITGPSMIQLITQNCCVASGPERENCFSTYLPVLQRQKQKAPLHACHHAWHFTRRLFFMVFVTKSWSLCMLSECPEKIKDTPNRDQCSSEEPLSTFLLTQTLKSATSCNYSHANKPSVREAGEKSKAW